MGDKVTGVHKFIFYTMHISAALSSLALHKVVRRSSALHKYALCQNALCVHPQLYHLWGATSAVCCIKRLCHSERCRGRCPHRPSMNLCLFCGFNGRWRTSSPARNMCSVTLSAAKSLSHCTKQRVNVCNTRQNNHKTYTGGLLCPIVCLKNINIFMNISRFYEYIYTKHTTFC